jgi:hypothetical protein
MIWCSSSKWGGSVVTRVSWMSLWRRRWCWCWRSGREHWSRCGYHDSTGSHRSQKAISSRGVHRMKQENLFLLKILNWPHRQIHLRLYLGNVGSHRYEPLVIWIHLLWKFDDWFQQILIWFTHSINQVSCMRPRLVGSRCDVCCSSNQSNLGMDQAIARATTMSPKDFTDWIRRKMSEQRDAWN